MPSHDSRTFRHHQQTGGDGEQRAPFRVDLRDVVGTGNDEMIDESEQQRGGHGRRDNESAGACTDEGNGKAHQRSGEDDDVDKEGCPAVSATWPPSWALPWSDADQRDER